MERFVLNGEPRPLESKMTISNMLVEETINPEGGIAVAVNQEVIPKKSWADHQIEPNDQVLIITATQGG